MNDQVAVFLGSGCGEPTELVVELVKLSKSSSKARFIVSQMLRGSSMAVVENANDSLRVRAVTAIPELVTSPQREFLTFWPCSISQFSQGISSREIVFDMALLLVSSPDENGNMSLGLSVDLAFDICQTSTKIIVEVNPNVPFVSGGSSINVSQVDGLIESDRDLLEVHPTLVSKRAKLIAEHVLEWIPDGATLELGIGSSLLAIPAALEVRNDLGIHTGLITTDLLDLLKSHSVTNSRKKNDKGISVTNQIRGNSNLYEYVHLNESLHVRPASYTHDSVVLGGLPAFRAVNSAIEVDLMGRVNSEILNGRRASSVGGLADFARAGRASATSRSIIALPSSHSGDTVGRIVNRLTSAESVSLPADLADVVVTEFGSVDLRNKCPEERAEAMISIAHPDHRDELRDLNLSKERS